MSPTFRRITLGAVWDTDSERAGASVKVGSFGEELRGHVRKTGSDGNGVSAAEVLRSY